MERVDYRAKLLIKLSRTLSDKIDGERARSTAKLLSELSDQDFLNACAIVGKKCRRFPAPAEFLEAVKTQIDENTESLEAAARIIGAIPKFGRYQPDLAKEYIGDIGWAVVMKVGGWGNVCSGLTVNNESTKFAQYRELAKSLIIRHKEGMGDVPPTLKSFRNQVLKELPYDKEKNLVASPEDEARGVHRNESLTKQDTE